MTSAARRMALSAALLVWIAAGSAPKAGVAQSGQSHMRLALVELGRASYQLSIDPRDRGGHRARALALTNSALAEVRAAIAEGVR